MCRVPFVIWPRMHLRHRGERPQRVLAMSVLWASIGPNKQDHAVFVKSFAARREARLARRFK